jgi:hypothetical protein
MQNFVERIALGQHFSLVSPLFLILFGRYCVWKFTYERFFFEEYCMAPNFGRLVQCYAILGQRYAA